MVRPLFVVLGFIALGVAAPARGQGLLDAIGDAIADSMDDGGNGGDFGSQNQQFNDGHHHHHHHPMYPSTHLDKVWVGDHWEYVPHTTGGYPGGTYVSPVRPAVVATNTLPYKGPGVTITLEEEEGGAVTYVIDGRESSTIQAGQEQTLTSKGTYDIRFSRGKAENGRDFGQARYTITEGDYHFKVTDKGWELFRDKEQSRLVTTQPASPSGIKTNVLPRKP